MWLAGFGLVLTILGDWRKTTSQQLAPLRLQAADNARLSCHGSTNTARLTDLPPHSLPSCVSQPGLVKDLVSLARRCAGCELGTFCTRLDPLVLGMLVTKVPCLK